MLPEAKKALAKLYVNQGVHISVLHALHSCFAGSDQLCELHPLHVHAGVGTLLRHAKMHSCILPIICVSCISCAKLKSLLIILLLQEKRPNILSAS